ncbi:MAG: hypothetical protein NVS3B7_00860 [Candidatus Elarobacter sp.]
MLTGLEGVHVAMGRRALAWIVAHRNAFAPEPGAAVPAQLVVLGELALLVHLLSRDDRGTVEVEACRNALGTAYDEASFARALAQDRSASLHAWLTVLLGMGDRQASAAARAIATGDPNVFAAERLPHRALELCWLLDALGWASPYAPAMEDVYRTTFLGRPHVVERASAADAYAVTHCVAYCTDFGRRPFFAAERPRVVADTRILLQRALGWEHYDLVAELLATLGWLRAPADGAQRGAWARLAAQQLPSGAVLGVPSDRALTTAIGAAEDGSFFTLLYHPTLVTVVAASAWTGFQPATGGP